MPGRQPRTARRGQAGGWLRARPLARPRRAPRRCHAVRPGCGGCRVPGGAGRGPRGRRGPAKNRAEMVLTRRQRLRGGGLHLAQKSTGGAGRPRSSLAALPPAAAARERPAALGHGGRVRPGTARARPRPRRQHAVPVLRPGSTGGCGFQVARCAREARHEQLQLQAPL